MAQVSKQVVLDAPVARIDLVVQNVTGAARAVVRGMFEHGCVSLNGKPCAEAGRRAGRGDVVAVVYEPERKYRGRPQASAPPPFRVAFEDAQVIVVEKPVGLLTVPTERGDERSLLDAVGDYLSASGRGRRHALVVHRLDRDTSGVLVFAKNPDAARALEAQFKSHKPDRTYDAIVAGVLRDDRGTFTSDIATGKNLKQFSTRFPNHGKPAVTHYEVVQRLDGATFVRVKLETGRRNQIRVHFSEAGHPVLGDTFYGREGATHPRWTAGRLALHARTLTFAHPVTGRSVQITSELPEAFAQFLA